MGDDTKLVLYCPHCGNTSVQTKLLNQRYTERSYWGSEAEEETHDALYTVTRCETCAQLLVYSECEDFTDDTPIGDLVFPKQSAFSDAVPENVRRVYHEALRVKQASPTAFVILARRVLEEICRAKGVTRPSLSQALGELAAQGVIPKTLTEASALIRLVGNAGAHASEIRITVPLVWAVDDFVKAVIEYLFVAPSRIEQFKASLGRSGSGEEG